MSNSGRKSSIAGRTISSIARRNSSEPAPAASGALQILPTPRSLLAPVPGAGRVADLFGSLVLQIQLLEDRRVEAEDS